MTTDTLIHPLPRAIAPGVARRPAAVTRPMLARPLARQAHLKAAAIGGVHDLAEEKP